MARRAIWATCGLLWLPLVAPATHAQDKDAKQEKAKIVAEVREAYRPNSGPRGQQSYRAGVAILDLPMLWARAATPTKTIIANAGTATKVLMAGESIPEMELQNVPGMSGSVSAFCSPASTALSDFVGRNRTGGSFGVVGLRVLKNATDQQFCVVDADGDGRVDTTFELNGGTSEARRARPIPPTPITIHDLVPISDEYRLRLRFLGGSKKGLSFELELEREGQLTRPDEIEGSGYSAKRITTISTKVGWPQQADIFGARFDVLGYDEATRAVTIGWPRDAPDIVVNVATNTTYYTW